MKVYYKRTPNQKRLLLETFLPVILTSFIALSLLLVLSGEGNAQAKCGPCSECPKPLVEVKPMEIKGDIPNITRLIRGFRQGKEMGGWDDVQKGMPNIFTNSQRAWEFFVFQKRNPCADMYFNLERDDGSVTRIGVPRGKAKFIVRSRATIKLDNAQIYVNYSSGEGEKPAPVPVNRLGTIEFRHELVALKNGETYDSGTENDDWVPDPPEGKTYYQGNTGDRGIISGSFTPGDLTGNRILLDKGDVGITIRKKETPLSASLEIDDTSVYSPLLKLYVKNIRNYFHEPLPKMVRIALKVDKGEIKGGEELNGWKVFETIGGEIPLPILYEGPGCSKTKRAKLRIGGLCDFHHGKPSVCKTSIVKQIPIPKCYSISGTVKLRDVETNQHEKSGPSQEFKKDKWSTHKEVTISMNFEDRSGQDYTLISNNIARYRYKLKSYWIISHNYYGEHSHSEVSYWHKYVYNGNWEGSVENVAPEGDELVLDVDRRSGSIVHASWPDFTVKLNILGFTKCTMSDRFSGMSGWNNNDCSDSINDQEEFYVGYSQLDEAVCEKPRFGDGVHIIGGNCKNTNQTSGGQEDLSYEWRIHRR